MFKTLAVAALLVALGVLPIVASAQDCTIAAYADPAGTMSLLSPSVAPFHFSVYIVMFTEDVAAAAAYKFEISNLNRSIFLQNRIAGPSGSGLTLDESPAWIGTNVALAECVIGFGGLPVLVEEYYFFALQDPDGTVATISANTNQNPLYPEYVTCNDVQKDCLPGPNFIMGWVFPTEARSFSAIKSLY